MREETRKKNIRTIGVMMALTLLGKVLGLARDLQLGHRLATGMEADAFLAASRIPRNFFDAVFASAISASFIPVFNMYLEKKGKAEAFRLSSAFITVISIATLGFSALGMAFSPQITGFLADGFEGEAAQLCSSLLRILFPTVFFTGAAFSIVGILQSLGEFNIPALLSTASNAVIIAYFFLLFGRFGVFGLAWAFLAGWAVQVLMQLPSLRRFGYSYRPSLRHEGLSAIWKLMLPVLVSTWMQPVNLTAAAKFASRIEGGASSLEYANTLYTIVTGVFVLSIANVIFPELSRLSAHGDGASIGEAAGQTLREMLFILIPMSAGLFALAEPLIRLLYEWGDWGPDSTALTAGALAWLSLGMTGYGIQVILSRLYYAMQEGRLPLVSGAVSVAVNIALCALLWSRAGISGLAASLALSTAAGAAVLLTAYLRRFGGSGRSGAVDIIKMLAASAVMTASVIACAGMTAGFSDGLAGRALKVLVPTIAGAAVYFACALLLKIDTFRQLLGLFRKRKND